MNFLFAGYQQGQIAEAKTDAIEAKMQAAQYSDRVQALEAQVNHMALACQAMWEILRDRVGITEPELLAKINEVDLRDGAKDGRMRPTLIKCPTCGKPANTKHTSCMYCGAAIPKRHVFE
jgi:ribosomal protein L32